MSRRGSPNWLKGVKNSPKKEGEDENEQAQTQGSGKKTRGPLRGEPAVNEGVDKTEEHEPDDDGGWINHHQGQRLQPGPDGDELGALPRWVEENSPSLPAEADEAKGQEHRQIQGQTSGQSGYNCAGQRVFHKKPENLEGRTGGPQERVLPSR